MRSSGDSSSPVAASFAPRADPSAVLPAEHVVGLVEDDQLAASLGGPEEFAGIAEGLQDGPARRDLPNRLRVPAVRGVHLDDAPAHLLREGERGAGLPDAGRALQDDRFLVRSTALPCGRPLAELGDRGRIRDDVVEVLRSVSLRPAHARSENRTRGHNPISRVPKPPSLAGTYD